MSHTLVLFSLQSSRSRSVRLQFLDLSPRRQLHTESGCASSITPGDVGSYGAVVTEAVGSFGNKLMQAMGCG